MIRDELPDHFLKTDRIDSSRLRVCGAAQQVSANRLIQMIGGAFCLSAALQDSRPRLSETFQHVVCRIAQELQQFGGGRRIDESMVAHVCQYEKGVEVDLSSFTLPRCNEDGHFFIEGAVKNSKDDSKSVSFVLTRTGKVPRKIIRNQ